MGKAKRIKQQRRLTPGRRMVVVSDCEVGQDSGMLTLRVGGERTPPVCIAIPAATATDLVRNVQTASVDAEELYWQAIPLIMRGITPGDQVAATAALESWLLTQDWATVLRRVPVSEDEMFLVTHAGHVGLAIAPPFTDKRTLAIFDPMQLRRLTPTFHNALAAAHANGQPVVTPQTVTAVVEFLTAQPWPSHGEYREPTFEDASTEMRHRYQEFLAREPYLRSDEHNLPDA